LLAVAVALQAAAVLGGGERQRGGGAAILDPRGLEKFVDELPDMPRLRGYGIAEGGALVAGNLTIGMYDTSWVSTASNLSTLIFVQLCPLLPLYTLVANLNIYVKLGRYTLHYTNFWVIS